MRKVFSFVLAMLFLLCSCTNDSTASDNESADKTNSSDSTSSSVQGMPPLWWTLDLYTDRFRYSSIDDFCGKIINNGTDELYETNDGCDHQLYDNYHDKRRENISKVVDNCVYETYYKGRKLEIDDLLGFNVHLGQENPNGLGEPSYCEYFVKLSDDPDGKVTVAHVRFYEMSRVKKDWDYFYHKWLEDPSYYDNDYRTNASMKLPYNGSEVNCLVRSEYNSETNTLKYGVGTWLCIEYNEEVLVFFDFYPALTVQNYDDLLYETGYQHDDKRISLKTKLKQRYSFWDPGYLTDNGNLINFLNDFEFQKVIVSERETQVDGSVSPK